MSQLLSRLQQEYAVLSDPTAKAEIAAQIAGIFARHGSFLEARQVIEHLQQGFGKGQSVQVTVMKMIAEGLVFHYEKLSPAANARLLGALSLAKMTGYQKGIALSAAWKAHVEFERSEYVKMADSLRIAMASVSASQHDAWVRISAVMSNCYFISGMSERGHIWFRRGHEHAAKLGDTESIDALLYNKAAFSLACLRVSACEESPSPDLMVRIRSEVNSARNLQKLAGVTALSAHVEIMDARLLVLERKFESAIAALQSVRGKEPFAAHNFSQSLIDLEVAYCRVMSAAPSAVTTADWISQADDLSSLDVDDRLVALWMTLEIYRRTGRAEVCGDIEARLARTCHEYQADRLSLQQLLTSVSED